MIFKQKIKAGALQFVLFIGAVVAVLLLSFVLVTYSHNIFHKKTDITVSLIKTADMGLKYSFQDPMKVDIPLSLPIKNELGIKTTVVKKYWGLHELRRATAKKQKLQFEKIALVGFSNGNLPALYLKDNQRPLVLAGNTKITGTAFLPAKGVKMGNIYGNSYYGSTLVYGKQKQSGSSMPKISSEVMEQIKIMTSPRFEPKGETVGFKKGMQLKNSFRQATKIIKGNVVLLDNSKLSGHILVWATHKIVVTATTNLNDVVLVAPEIEIQNWTKGSMQAFASKRITVGKGCELAYPSALVVHTQKTKSDGAQDYDAAISLDAYSQLRGAMLFLDADEPNTFRPHVHIDEHAKVYGEVYSTQNTELKGSVYGNVSTSAFVALENGNVYQNHIYNGKINTEVLPGQYAGLSFENNLSNQIMKWLY